MGWYARLGEYDITSNEWNYTHNCNQMLEAAIDQLHLPERFGVDGTRKPWWVKDGAATYLGRGSWWTLLNGQTAAGGYEFLDTLIRVLEGDPAHFEAMNPTNGWGDYHELLECLRSMCNASASSSEHWYASG